MWRVACTETVGVVIVYSSNSSSSSSSERSSNQLALKMLLHCFANARASYAPCSSSSSKLIAVQLAHNVLLLRQSAVAQQAAFTDLQQLGPRCAAHQAHQASDAAAALSQLIAVITAAIALQLYLQNWLQ
eukprot:14483-Heterococcus_DN1.PRE.1